MKQLMEAATTIASRHPRLIALQGLAPFLIHTHSGPDRYISPEIAATGVWEPLETELIRRLLPRYDLFLDVGANIGWYSVVGSLSLGVRGIVHAFEPDPENFALLAANVRANGLENVVVHLAAVAERERVGQLMRDADNMGDHRLDAQRHGRDAGIAVPVMALDQLFPDPPPFLMKADTQGSEPAVLAGMRGMLQRRRLDCSLIMEFWPHGMVSTGGSTDAMLTAIALLPDHTVLILDEAATRLRPTSVAELAEAAGGELAPETKAFWNLAILPHGVAHSRPVRMLT